MAAVEWLIVGVTRVGGEVESWEMEAEKKVGTSIEAGGSLWLPDQLEQHKETLSQKGGGFPGMFAAV